MSTRSRPREPARYGLYESLKDSYQPLPADQQADADFERRFASVIPYLMEKCARFVRTLKDSQRTNYDPEDVFVEVYLELQAKNDKFDPEVARYITFASMVAGKMFSKIKDQSTTVEACRNSGSHLRDYEDALAAGRDVSPQRAATAEKLKHTRNEYLELNAARDVSRGDKPDADVIREEERCLAEDALSRAIGHLSPYQAAVIGARAGLWGQPRQEVHEIARDLGSTTKAVRHAAATAREKIRRVLIQCGHPVAWDG